MRIIIYLILSLREGFWVNPIWIEGSNPFGTSKTAFPLKYSPVTVNEIGIIANFWTGKLINISKLTVTTAGSFPPYLTVK